MSKGKEKAVTLSAGFGKQALQKVTDLKEKAARSRVRRVKEVEQQVLGNEGMARTQAQQLKGKGWKMCLETRKRLHVQK